MTCRHKKTKKSARTNAYY